MDQSRHVVPPYRRAVGARHRPEPPLSGYAGPVNTVAVLALQRVRAAVTMVSKPRIAAAVGEQWCTVPWTEHGSSRMWPCTETYSFRAVPVLQELRTT